jgi:methionine-rich copper-binding protein CopC
MASTYTVLGTQLMATGENAGTWGTKTNTNLNIIEQIAGGYLAVDINGGAQTTTLSVSDGSTGAALAHRVIEFTGAITGNQIVTIPLDVQTFYIVKNTTSDGSDAYTVQFKYVSGTGGSVTFAGGDRGTKIIYATANDATDPDIVDATSAFVTATSTTTLTNKTLTAPKFANGGFIADTTGAETLVFGEVSTPVNEVKITNAATGTAGPIIASQGESNSNLQLRPSGTGMITTGTAAAHSTISSNGAYNLILETNEGTNSGTITITDAANGEITLTPNGTGVVDVEGSMNPSVSSTGKAMVLGF